jgi:hypothetical protein
VTLIEELVQDAMVQNSSIVSASYPTNSSLFTFTNTLSSRVFPGNPVVAAVLSKQEMKVTNGGLFIIDLGCAKAVYSLSKHVPTIVPVNTMEPCRFH